MSWKWETGIDGPHPTHQPYSFIPCAFLRVHITMSSESFSNPKMRIFFIYNTGPKSKSPTNMVLKWGNSIYSSANSQGSGSVGLTEKQHPGLQLRSSLKDFQGASLTLGKSLRIYVLQKTWLFCTIYYLSPTEMVQVELGRVCESIFIVPRWWTSKKAIAMFGVWYLKHGIRMTDTSLWLLSMVVDGTTDQRLKPKTCESNTSLPNTLPPKHLLRCFSFHSLYSHHNTTWVSAHVPADLDPSHLDSALSSISPHDQQADLL